MKKFCYLLLFILFTPLSQAEPLYWQATKGKLTYLLLGSVHVGDQSMYPLPVNITTFLKHSDGLVVETDIRSQQNIRFPATKVTTEQVLSDNNIRELKGIAGLLNLDPQQLLIASPWVTALTIQQKQIEYLGYRAQDGVDLALLRQASSLTKPIYSLESVQFQIDMLASLPNDGEELLTSAIEQFDINEEAAHCLINSWKSGDIENLNEFAKLSEMSPQMEEAFMHQRNRDWAEKLTQGSIFPSSEGNYLIVVGSLHLIGPENLLTLLESRGFKVTQRSQSQAANCQFNF